MDGAAVGGTSDKSQKAARWIFPSKQSFNGMKQVLRVTDRSKSLVQQSASAKKLTKKP